jgi:hypothetical protein
VAPRLLFWASGAVERNGRNQEEVMNRKNTVPQDRRIRLAVKKETLKDLSANTSVLGGFIMKDTIIVKTSTR